MNTTHYPHWPANLPYAITTPETSVYENLAISARRYPAKPAIIFYDTVLSYAQVHEDVLTLAGYLQQVCGVQRGDRVLLNVQNSPQFIIAFYAILRADAMVVPMNPMLMPDELQHYVDDSGAKAAIVAQDIFARIAPLIGSTVLKNVVMATYSDYLRTATELTVPDFVRAPYEAPATPGAIAWKAAVAARHAPLPHTAGPDDLACMPYTSGTTGKPKGCVHTHRNLMFNAVASPTWAGLIVPDNVTLAVVPFFHVTGMQSVMNATIYCGGALVPLPRWDRDAAGQLITRYKVSSWTLIPTMMIDFLSNPRMAEYNISSLRRISGGGAAMPAAIAQKLLELTGQTYMEGYGLSETMGASHVNPPQRMKQQCLGVPYLNVDSRIVDPITFEEVAQGETGDLGYMDEEGFFFFTDRLKRMINAAGFKVWPAEVEAMMYQNPAVQECCIIAARDAYRGETVKAVIVRRAGVDASAEDIIAWSREKMAVYKTPRIVEFVDALPRSATGKVMWRTLQERENEQTS